MNTAPSYRAEPSSLPILAAQRVDAQALARDAEDRGWIDEVNRHHKLINRLVALIAGTGLSLSTICRNTALRAIVEEHKHAKAADTPMTAITDEIATLRAAVTTLAESVRSHEDQLRKLRN